MSRTRNEILADINANKQLLAQTDYKALKHADGAMTEEEYASTREQRASFRAAVNELESELAAAPVEALAE